MGWEIILHNDVEAWFLDLSKNDPVSADQVADAINTLEVEGPTLGRPLVDRIQGSRHHNMKELRPGSSGGSELRLLFAFDPVRRAIILVAGDKARAWTQWYRANIPVADARYDEHLETMEEEGPA
ncbi:type II toxin-antitoxin system RelE/ParE family toxin [Kitasatospora hibisci]|uniref:type II toxin-antitoxin system RelE/ParE family toxin n=1 Tax=Kitasatospora hibisci TaxID=3369522 RepID=UPI00375451DA